MTEEENTTTNVTENNTEEESSNDDCSSLLINKNCKYFHHEPYYTPNNYDLYFNYNDIPRNIHIEKPSELRKRLQRTLPLTKIIHINLQSEIFPEQNTVTIETSTTLKVQKTDGKYEYKTLK